MKKSFLLAGGFSLALFFAACGDDSSSNGTVDQETDVSSSSVGDSTDESSSSKEQKDPSIPEGARAATLEDLNKHQIIEIKGEKFLLATGSKVGIFGLWTTDSVESIDGQELLIVRSDFSNGKLKLDGKTSFMHFTHPNATKEGAKILEEISQGKLSQELAFIVEKKTLKYGVGKSDYQKVEPKGLILPTTYVTDANKLTDKQVVCETSDDTTMVYSFYKGGRYIAEKVVKGDTISWNAGYVDVFYNLTFMLSDFAGPQNVQKIGGFAYKSTQIFYAGLSKMTDINKIAEIPCTASELKYTSVDESKIMGVWVGKEDGEDWIFDLLESREWSMKADDGAKEKKGGKNWAIYGNQLLLDVEYSSSKNAALGIKGPLSKVSEKGFTYNHSDKGTPAIPKTWEQPDLQ